MPAVPLNDQAHKRQAQPRPGAPDRVRPACQLRPHALAFGLGNPDPRVGYLDAHPVLRLAATHLDAVALAGVLHRVEHDVLDRGIQKIRVPNNARQRPRGGGEDQGEAARLAHAGARGLHGVARRLLQVHQLALHGRRRQVGQFAQIRHEHSHAPGLGRHEDRGLVVGGRRGREDRRQGILQLVVQARQKLPVLKIPARLRLRRTGQALPRQRGREKLERHGCSRHEKPGRNEEDGQGHRDAEFQVRTRQPPCQGADARDRKGCQGEHQSTAHRVTFPMKRYPPEGTVSINTGSEGSSPRAARISRMRWSTARVEEAKSMPHSTDRRRSRV